MTEPRTWTLCEAIAGLAFVTLVLAALLAPADQDGVVSLAVVGLALWVLFLARAWFAGRTDRVGRRCLVTAATLVVLGAADATGAWLSLRAADPAFLCWFGLAVSFAAAGFLTSLREEPDDMTFVAQLLFHGLFLLPLAAFVAEAVMTGRPVPRGTLGATGPLLRTAALVGSVAAPCVLAMLAVAAAINLGRPQPQRKPVWTALLAHEIALVLILSRWALGAS